MQKDKVKDLMDLVFPQQQQIPMATSTPIPQMEGLVPIQTTPIEDYDAMVEADKIEKSMVDTAQAGNMIPTSSKQIQQSSQKVKSSPISIVSPTPEDDFRKQYLRQLEEARNQNRDDMMSAREKDNQVALLNNMNKAISQAGTGIANQAGYTKLTANPLEVSSNKAGEAGMDNKANLESLAQMYGVNKDAESSEANKAKLKLDAEDRQFDRSYKQQMLNFQQAKTKEDKKELDNAGQKELDKQAAKEYQEWSSGGAKIAQSEIGKLKNVLKDLKSGKVTTGGLTDTLPDQLVDSDYLSARSDVQSSVMGSLRALLGAQFTEKEGERVIANTWNKADSTENNIGRVERLVNDLENKAKDKTNKAEYFQKAGSTLKGYQSNLSSPSESSSSESTGPYGDTVEKGGKQYKWNPSAGKYQPL